jgi:hypothetical protein
MCSRKISSHILFYSLFNIIQHPYLLLNISVQEDMTESFPFEAVRLDEEVLPVLPDELTPPNSPEYPAWCTRLRDRSPNTRIFKTNRITQYFTLLYHTTLNFITTNRITQYFTLLYHTAPHRTAPHRTSPYFTTLHFTLPRCTLLYHTAPHFTLLYHVALYFTTPHLTLPRCTLLYHTVPHFTLL